MTKEKLTEAEKLREWASFFVHYGDWLHKYADVILYRNNILSHLADVLEKTEDEG